MERQILKLFIKFLTYYLLNHPNTDYYFAIADIKEEAQEIVNKL